METKANYVAVGAFVLAGIIALIVALVWIAGLQYREEYAYYQVSFTGPVTGLGKGTVVRYNGIDMGRVDDLVFDPEDPKKVVATLQVDGALQIHADSTASIESQGLTGGSYVEIEGGTRAAPLLPATTHRPYPAIASKPSTLQQLYQSSPELLARLNQLTDRASDLLNDRNREAVSQIVANLSEITGALKNRSADIDASLTNIAQAANKLNGTLASVDNAAKRVGDAAGAAVGVLADSRAQVAASTQHLDLLLAQTRGLVATLNRLSDELEREPTRLLFGDRRQGYTPP